MFNNLVANLISNIRVTVQHKRQGGCCHYSKFNLSILNRLAEKSIVKNINIEMRRKRKYIVFEMPNYNYTYFINKIACYYSASAYHYYSYIHMKSLIEKYEEGLVSTNQGVLFIRECINKKIGGKLILLYR